MGVARPAKLSEGGRRRTLSSHRVLLLLAAVAPVRAQDLADVFAKVSPAVVTIHTVEARVTGDQKPRLEGGMKTGSGVLLDRDGTVLTAAHVVELADELSVEFFDGTKRPAMVVAAQPGADLALVQLRGELPAGVTPCVLGDSSAARVGNQVFAVGAPLGMGHTLTAGYVSARRRDERFLEDMRTVEHFQTDVAINPGNSGGPLFNLRGEVIGIVCHIVSSSVGSEGLGFAVTSNAVRGLLLEHRQVWLGFDAQPLSESLSRALNVPDGKLGFLVLRVAKASPAHRAGLRAGSIPARIAGRDLLLGGDIVIEIQGQPLGSPAEAEQAALVVRKLTPDDTLRLSVLREGKIVELLVRFGG
ncbi:MAG: trypsin-like peptidase domain-containing protein [Planctomycetota bacterium]